MKELLAGARVIPEHTCHRACDGVAARLLNTSHYHAHVTVGVEGREGEGACLGRGLVFLST